MKKKRSLLRKNKKTHFKRKSINVNWQKVFIFLVIIPSLIIFSIYIIFFGKKNTLIADSKAKNLIWNNETFSDYNINEKLIGNNETIIDFNKVDFINGRLIWNNQTSIDYSKIKEEIRKYNELQFSFENKEDFIKREKPRITVIITLYNQEKYIRPIYASVQKQELKDIEIIFVDDCSRDNTTKKIKELMEKDKRIVYLKNDINRKSVISRFRGALIAKGEYILMVDPDDLLINNILIKAYITAKKYNLDIVQFHMMIGSPSQSRLWGELKYKGGILKNNSEVRKIFYYGISRNLPDKLVRREIYLKCIKFMGDEFINGDYHFNEDDTIFFGLIHIAETYGFLEDPGYMYILRGKPTNKTVNEITNENFHSIFTIMRYFYIKSDNNEIEKSNTAYKYFQKSLKGYGKHLSDMTEGFDFALDVLNLYLNSTYFKSSQKNYINDFKSKIIERQNKIKKFI